MGKNSHAGTDDSATDEEWTPDDGLSFESAEVVAKGRDAVLSPEVQGTRKERNWLHVDVDAESDSGRDRTGTVVAEGSRSEWKGRRAFAADHVRVPFLRRKCLPNIHRHSLHDSLLRPFLSLVSINVTAAGEDTPPLAPSSSVKIPSIERRAGKPTSVWEESEMSHRVPLRKMQRSKTFALSRSRRRSLAPEENATGTLLKRTQDAQVDKVSTLARIDSGISLGNREGRRSDRGSTEATQKRPEKQGLSYFKSIRLLHRTSLSHVESRGREQYSQLPVKGQPISDKRYHWDDGQIVLRGYLWKEGLRVGNRLCPVYLVTDWCSSPSITSLSLSFSFPFWIAFIQMKMWKRRFFVLQGRTLSYYKDESVRHNVNETVLNHDIHCGMIIGD